MNVNDAEHTPAFYMLCCSAVLSRERPLELLLMPCLSFDECPLCRARINSVSVLLFCSAEHGEAFGAVADARLGL